jgi:hypothetical protein
MNYHDIQELLDLVAGRLTTDEIMDILGWEMHDLVGALQSYIEECADDFERAVME